MNSSLYRLMLENFWVVSITWLVLVMVDNFLSVMELNIYRKGAHNHLTLYDGSEINPFFAPNLGPKEFPSFTAIVYGGSGYLFLWLIWTMRNFSGAALPTWEFAAGMALLIQVPMLVRHLRWVVFLTMAQKIDDRFWLEGKIKSAPCFFYRQHSVDMYLMSFLCSVVFFATGKAFFAGGTLASIMIATLYWFRK